MKGFTNRDADSLGIMLEEEPGVKWNLFFCFPQRWTLRGLLLCSFTSSAQSTLPPKIMCSCMAPCSGWPWKISLKWTCRQVELVDGYNSVSFRCCLSVWVSAWLLLAGTLLGDGAAIGGHSSPDVTQVLDGKRRDCAVCWFPGDGSV